MRGEGERVAAQGFDTEVAERLDVREGGGANRDVVGHWGGHRGLYACQRRRLTAVEVFAEREAAVKQERREGDGGERLTGLVPPVCEDRFDRQRRCGGGP